MADTSAYLLEKFFLSTETINYATFSAIYHYLDQHDVPQGKHALITVKQPKGNLVWIIAGNQAQQQTKSEKEKFKPKLQTWSECDSVQVRKILPFDPFFMERNDRHDLNRIS